MELILVVFALFAIATPFATVFLLWRQHKIRQQLLKLTELSVQVADGLRRDLQELKRQVESSAAPHPSADSTSETPAVAAQFEGPAAPVISETKKPVEPVPPVVAPLVTAPQSLPVFEKKPEVVAEAHEESPQVSIAGPPTTVAPAAPSETHPAKESIEQVVATEAIVPPATESKPPATIPPTPDIPPKQLEAVQHIEPATAPPVSPRETPTRSTTPVPPPSTGRVTAPPQFAAFRSAAPKATTQQRMKSVFAMEEVFGKSWLNKLGIVLVVFGVASFGVYELGQLGPVGKVGLSYVVSLALLGGGVYLEKRDRYRVLGHTLIGGGWALLFFTTYAMNHVQAMRVMNSETTNLILMLAVAIGMVVHTLRYRSQVVTGLAFLLAYGTVALSHDDVYSLSSGVILAMGLVAIVIKMGWFELEVFGVLSSYLNHAYWLYRLLGPSGAQGHAFPEYHASTAILLFYWLIYRISYIVRKTKTPYAEHVSTAAALINTLFLLGVMKFQSVHPELAFIALLVIGAIEFAFGQLPMTRKRREAFIVLSVLGTALMIAAVPFRYSGNNVAILWLVGAEVFLAAGVMMNEVVFRRLGLLTGLLVGAHLIAVDFQELMVARRAGEGLLLSAGIMFALSAAVYYLNVLYLGRRWRLFFVDAPDEPLLRVHSYIGGFAAASAAWALCSGDWTAIAFAGIMLTLAVLGQKPKSPDLQVQYALLGILSLYRVVEINLHTEVPQYTHVTTRLITLPVIAAAFYLTAKWAPRNQDDSQRIVRGMFAFAGTALITALIYYEVPELWQPLAAIAFAIALLEVGQRIDYSMLTWHTHVLGGLAVLAAVYADYAGLQRWHDIPLHAFGALPVVAGAYWIARRIREPRGEHVTLGRIAYSWAGTGVMAWVLYEAIPAPWIAVSWIVFAVLLVLVMRRVGYAQLAWQANALAACSIARSYTFNLELEQSFWLGTSLRLVTISLVAAGLYFLSRKATVADSGSKRAVSYLHTLTATALIAFLAWHEAPSGWLAAVWAVFALVLTLVDRRFDLEDLRWQAHALAALTLVRSVVVNLYVTDTWHGISVRLLSLSIVAVVFYALSRLIRMPEQLREREFHHVYSWAASALVSLLMWYELQPLSVAVGWAVFGLVLFQYGVWRNTRQFRFQAYIALSAAFGRIFFANLTAGTPDEFWGPRVYTVLPITLILFFVYAQLRQDDPNTQSDRALRFDMLLAYLGTGSVVALLYFQFANEWLVTAWAVVVFLLFGVALLLNRSVFLRQGLLLTLGACSRGVMHNLFGASYFSRGDWTGRYFVLGSGIAVLLACLPFAFRWRERYKSQSAKNWMGAIARHPEQVMFFSPVALLTLMLALKMRSGMITVSWGIESLSILIFAFLINERSYRLTGLLLLLVCFGKILVIDMWGLETRDRYITLIIVGAAMSVASFLYAKYSDKIRQFL